MEGGFIIGAQPNSSSGSSSVPLAKNVDFIGDYIYVGEAIPGTPSSEAAWRLSRIYLSPIDGDVVVTWADGNSNYDNVWDSHLSLTYI
jgi:hypothetical protein